MIYRGEIYYGENQTSLFVIYGSRESVTEAVCDAFLQLFDENPNIDMSILNIFVYWREKIKWYIHKDWSQLSVPEYKWPNGAEPRGYYRIRRKEEQNNNNK